MPRIYQAIRSPLEGYLVRPQTPYQAAHEPQPAAEDAAHNEAAHTDTPHDTVSDVDADTVSDPPFGMDPSVTKIPPQHHSHQTSWVHLSDD